MSFYAGFANQEDMLSSFDVNKDVLDGCEVIYAVYDHEGYDGSAFVLYQKDGKLFEVYGSHCSCMGLEGQWTPEETTKAAIAIREGEIYERILKLI